ncbi:MAG: hypothetical protein ABI921_00565 [Panacibacter sp.]
MKKKVDNPENSEAEKVQKIGEILKQEFPLAEVVNANPDGVQRCRFDLFVRYNKREKREKETFTYRGDFWGEKEPPRMLWSLVRMFCNNYRRFFYVELYDNSKAKNDPARIILKVRGGTKAEILENRLDAYASMLENYPVQEWLKPKK